MNAPVIRSRILNTPILDNGGEALSSAEAWRALLDSDQARTIAPPRSQEPVGHKARRLFRDLSLYSAPKHPALRLLYTPVLRQIALSAHAAYCLFRVGGDVQRRFGKSRLRQAGEIAALAFQEGFDANTYYMQELYRPLGRRRASRTLTRFETKNGLLKELKELVPLLAPKRISLGDKLAFHDHCKAHAITTIPVLLTATNGTIDRRAKGLAPEFAGGSDLFIKPRHGKGAQGAAFLRRLGDDHYCTSDGRIMTHAQLLDDLARRSLTMPYLLQPRLVNHADIADLASESLLVVRVITCLDARGIPSITHGMLRVIGKLEPDWNDITEYAAPIDLATGRMGAMTGDKLGAALSWHDRHPITGAPVTGRILAAWPEIRRAALAAHKAFADRLLLGWDIAVTPQGVIIVEGNALPDVAFLQRVHRQAIGDSPLGPLLQGYLDLLEMTEP